MLSASSSQYLQPDYIQPLPSSLDVNSSPLALLAQTCSSIGKDTGPPSKAGGGGGGGGTGSVSSSDKKAPPPPHAAGNGARESNGGGGGTRSKSESPPIGRNVPLCAAEERSKSRTSGNEKKDSGHHGLQRCTGGKGGSVPKPGFRVPPTPSKESSAASIRAGGGGGDRVSVDSGSAVGDGGGRSSRESLLQPPVPSTRHGTLVGNAVSAKSAGAAGNSCSSMLLELNQEALSKSSLHGGPLHPLYGSLKDGIQALHGSLAPSSFGALPFLGYPLSLDPLAAAAAYSASLAAHCSGLAAAAAAAGLGLSAQKSPSTPAAAVSGIVSSTPCSAAVAALPPYASYVRMKTAAGGTTLVPVCKDPYCAHCQVALHGAAQLAAVGGGAGSPCSGPGCGQCTAHGKSSPTSLASPTIAGLPFFPPPPPSSGLCSHAAFSSPAGLQGTSPMHGGPLVTPYVCNWVQGSDGYCGKRFSSSDDLLQHLRSHTSTTAAGAADSPLVSPFHHVGLPLSSIGFPFGGLLGCPTLSPGGLLCSAPSSYPRSLSPNSLLSAARYHPYKPPSLSVLPCTTPPGLSAAFPSLAAYYSPYAFYGQRGGVGTAAAVGP